MKRKRLLVVLLVLLLLVVDQTIKIAVKTNMHLYESIWITDWFQIHFIENNGMAFGLSFINKYVLTLFRIAAVVVIGWYIHRQITLGVRTRYVFLLTLLLAGAAGNIIDCMFYGEIFTASSPFYVSYLVPFGHGYSGFLTGKVVDMFYFPLIQATWPEWVPIWGGEDFVFFSPVFNFADACVSVSVVALFLFCRPELATLSMPSKTETDAESEDNAEKTDSIQS
ncbi:MAG: lipoprotein signal peptidase [Prevotella sp.]|nr:lipoprotein signal peptidase [Prevotella sp.]